MRWVLVLAVAGWGILLASGHGSLATHKKMDLLSDRANFVNQALVSPIVIEPGDIEAPFAAETGQLPAKKLYRDVKSLMDRVRELRFVKPETPATAPACGADG